MHWTELNPEPGIVAALDHAGDRPSPDSNQNEKRRWSEKFANGCAIAVAHQFRHSSVSNKHIRPLSLEDGTEPLTPLGSGTSKRIDVVIADSVLGLEIGVSLKGLNFRDNRSNNFDKNLTGRMYELGDEVRLVHEHLPHAFMAGLFFLPLDSALDKTDSANSSFANTMLKLRERTGRLDPAIAAHAPRCDAAYVALYTLGSEIEGLPRGIVRFMSVESNPPKRGRPKADQTMSLAEMVDEIVSKATFTTKIVWAEPEEDR